MVEVEGGTYRVWIADGMPEVKWEWHLKHLRRIHWHKTMSKLEVEAGRCVSVSSVASSPSSSLYSAIVRPNIGGGNGLLCFMIQDRV